MHCVYVLAVQAGNYQCSVHDAVSRAYDCALFAQALSYEPEVGASLLQMLSVCQYQALSDNGSSAEVRKSSNSWVAAAAQTHACIDCLEKKGQPAAVRSRCQGRLALTV